MARIQWTESEQDTLYTAIADQLKKSPKLYIIKAATNAQLALPANRRRRLVLVENLPDYLRKRLILNGMLPENWQGVRLRQRDRAPKLSAEQIIKLQGDNATLRADLAKALSELQQQRAELNTYRNMPKPPSEADVVKRFLADILADALASHKALPGPRMEPVKAPPGPRHNPEAKSILSGNGRKPRVVLIGTKPEQASMLQSEFQKTLDLRCYIADASIAQLQVAAGNADRVLVWTDFVNHSVTEGIPKDNRILVNGGMTALRSALNEIVDESAH